MKYRSLLVVLLLAMVWIGADVPADYKSVYGDGYTLYYPQDWHVGQIYRNTQVFEDSIMEHAMLWNGAKAYITLDVWKCNVPGDIEMWLRIADKLGLENMGLEKTVATDKNLPAVLYRYIADKQSFNSQMMFFKYMDKVYRLSYCEGDSGQSDNVYKNVVRCFSFDKNGEEIAPIARDAFQKGDSRVYSCGGYNDTCNCSMDNPYPCCDNNSNCTWWAWSQACCVWGIGLPSPWRNAKCWAVDLGSHGYPVSSNPAVNTIACRDIGTYGHVAWVVEVSGSRVKVSEMNCCTGCAAGMRYQWYDASYFTGGYIYKK